MMSSFLIVSSVKKFQRRRFASISDHDNDAPVDDTRYYSNAQIDYTLPVPIGERCFNAKLAATALIATPPTTMPMR
eukprot:scaffold24097_cov18-Prasinocladus_malaysianus.AAC.3